MTPGAFRLFLAFVVVIHHSFALRLGAWAVGMFFVLSGYWIARMWRLKYAELPASYQDFLISRWWRLAPLYLAVQLLAVILVLVGLPTGNGAALNNPWWWLSQPLIAGGSQFDRLLPPTWSLDVEMQFYMLAPILIIGLGSIGCPARLLLVALSGWGAIRLATGATLETPLLDVYLWLFLAGVLCDLNSYRPSNRTVIVSLVAALGVLALVAWLPETRSWVWRRGAEGPGSTGFGDKLAFFVLTILTLPFAISTVYNRSGGWDQWLGDLSYPLYLFHWLPRDWYYANVDWSKTGWWNGSLLLTNFVAAFVGATLLLHLVDRPAQQARKRWTYSRGITVRSLPRVSGESR